MSRPRAWRRGRPYAEILRVAGFRIRGTERHDDALHRMVGQIEARLALVRMTAREQAVRLGVDFETAPAVLDATRRAIDDGVLGYGLIVADRTATDRADLDRAGL